MYKALHSLICCYQGFIRLSVYLLTQDGGPSFPHASMASQGLVTAEDHTHVPDSDRMSGIAEEAETNVSYDEGAAENMLCFSTV